MKAMLTHSIARAPWPFFHSRHHGAAGGRRTSLRIFTRFGCLIAICGLSMGCQQREEVTRLAGPDKLVPASTDSTLHFDSGSKDSLRGESVAIGDLDGDGIDDLVFVDPEYAPYIQQVTSPGAVGMVHRTRGALVVVYGRKSWRSKEKLRPVVLEPEKADGTPIRVTAAGDVNGDGLADFLVESGIDCFMGKTQPLAPAYLVLGSKTRWSGKLPLGEVSRAIRTTQHCIQLAPRPLGDLNGDGFADYVVSSSIEGMTNQVEADKMDRAHVFYGSPDVKVGADSQAISSAAAVFLPATGLGHLTAVGDTDGDGLADFLVGQTGTYCTEMPGLYLVRGSVKRLAGNLSLADIGIPIKGASAYAAAAGDLDKDGLSDFLVKPSWSTPNDEIVYQLFYGRKADDAGDPLARTADATLVSPGHSRSSNEAVNLGDTDGDGFPELAIGNQSLGRQTIPGSDGGLHLLRGSTERLSGTVVLDHVASTYLHQRPSEDRTSREYMASGDVNGDGRGDLLLTKTGRIFLFLAPVPKERPVDNGSYTPPAAIVTDAGPNGWQSPCELPSPHPSDASAE